MSLKELSESRPSLTRFTCLLILLAFTVSAYLGVKSCGFIKLDDPDYVTQNPYIKQGLKAETLHWAFTEFHSSNWHPLTWMSHMTDVELFGLKPAGHHLHNVVLHALNVCLIFLLLNRLTAALGKSFLVAALFALHPLHVESVAWVAERKDVLSAFFGLLSLLAYVSYAKGISFWSARTCPRFETRRHVSQSESGDMSPQSKAAASRALDPRPCPLDFASSPAYWLSLLFLALGLMSKPMLVTWPFVMLLLDAWPMNRFSMPNLKRLVTQKIPFLMLAALSSVITMRAQSSGRSVVSLEWLPLEARISNSLAAVFDYLAKTFYPVKLAVFYPQPSEMPWQKAAAAAVIIVVCFYLAVRHFKKQPGLFVGVAWFLGTLVPVIGLVQVGMQASADRYTYIPHIGLFIALVWGGAELLSRLRCSRSISSAVSLGLLVACGLLTVRQVKVWESDLTLFGHAKEVTDRNYIALTIYGRQLADQGKNEEALALYLQAMAIQPRHAAGRYVIAEVYRNMGRTNEALQSYAEALELDPYHAESLNSRGALLNSLKRNQEAISDFKKAIEVLPAFEIPRFNMAVVLQQEGRYAESAAAFRDYLSLSPKSSKAWSLLGEVEFRMGRNEQAISSYQKALELEPKNAAARYGLACGYANAGRFLDAEKTLTQLISEDQSMPEAFFQLGVTSAALGKTNEALKYLEQAISLKGTNALYHYHRAIVLSQSGRKEDSIKAYEQTITLDDKFAEPLNNLAWLFATDADSKIRNGMRAVRLAERACELTAQKQAFLIGTLAAAYAEAGRFHEAVAAAQRAIELARTTGQNELATRNSELLELYRARQPYHEPLQALERK